MLQGTDAALADTTLFRRVQHCRIFEQRGWKLFAVFISKLSIVRLLPRSYVLQWRTGKICNYRQTFVTDWNWCCNALILPTYLTTLPVTHHKAQNGKFVFKGCGIERSWHSMKYYPVVCLEGRRKTTKTWALLVCELEFEPDCRLRFAGIAATIVDSSWNVMTHGDAREGTWRGNWRMDWVASTLHTTSEHGVSSITTADAHTSAASSRLNWRPPRPI